MPLTTKYLIVPLPERYYEDLLRGLLIAMESHVQPASRHLGIITIIFHFQAGPQEIKAGMY
jgi:hypothetical protein